MKCKASETYYSGIDYLGLFINTVSLISEPMQVDVTHILLSGFLLLSLGVCSAMICEVRLFFFGIYIFIVLCSNCKLELFQQKQIRISRFSNC